ncbi:MAG: helix-turn-helix transcriptional regulator [Actinomycetota bacterium]|nr:helix-turn-helix transcriptional regulator [Actinomycetota bacterium]
MPRTDENGRQLKALLDYLLDGDIDAKDLFDALGISSSTYYRRIKEDDYPNAEELRRVADQFQLSYPDLQIQFGLMSRQEVWQYIEATRATPGPAHDTAGTSTVTREAAAPPAQFERRTKLSELTPRLDAPPL